MSRLAPMSLLTSPLLLLLLLLLAAADGAAASLPCQSTIMRFVNGTMLDTAMVQVPLISPNGDGLNFSVLAIGWDIAIMVPTGLDFVRAEFRWFLESEFNDRFAITGGCTIPDWNMMVENQETYTTRFNMDSHSISYFELSTGLWYKLYNALPSCVPVPLYLFAPAPAGMEVDHIWLSVVVQLDPSRDLQALGETLYNTVMAIEGICPPNISTGSWITTGTAYRDARATVTAQAAVDGTKANGTAALLAIKNQQQDTAGSHRRFSLVIIAASAVSGVVVLMILVVFVLVVLYRRRHLRKEQQQQQTV
ncbi:hypothetical protein VOLCADRAFT_87104 [Volvox carteri f. nagariensis]|uniref:Pherophorin domain-containing protein n=1 Tax=Volvox carteri f. nagariensis TaxID=3068 RepID=D8TK65_VOLCA|nr:uncharacterized protein VOLCADRAFT_87104 [Volvox carteri f. nagariensis]EFJ52007.1 hypothetical protein VOLCADRAFT_87104 [Volvox carteri f. nagariensis]|eukprot:XP_002946781.1 hypothetical protein VOLCADRAFT_87104 [Volvox carteri f. nagariensis]